MMEFVHVELKRETWIKPEMNVRSEEDAILAVKKLIQNLDRELVICIHIATSGRVINASVCAMGTMDQAVISPAEVLRIAILSGCCKPSKEDLHVAKKLATACALLGIQLVDFIVVGASGFTHSVRGYEAEWLSPSYEWINAEIVSSNSKKQE